MKKNLKDDVIQALLKTLTYDDMTEEQLDLVVKYEMNKWEPKIKQYFENNGLKETERYIHETLWQNYEIADETEDGLLKFIGSDLTITM